MKDVIPYILGRGRAGRAIENAVSILKNAEPDLGIGSVRWLKRTDRLADKIEDPESSCLMLANPNALHAERILEASRLGVSMVVSEKPLAVTLAQIQSLQSIKTKIAVLHVYRQMWGPQRIRRLIEEGVLGELVTIEGRYWHSSAARRVYETEEFKENWKNDPLLSGPFDVLLDVGTHWLDMVFFLTSDKAVGGNLWLSYANAEKPHRDTHVHMTTEFKGGCRAFGSISKIAHGSSDHFEFHVIGKKRSAAWSFSSPDEIYMGEGRARTLITRSESQLGSRQPPFRGLGWVDGYVEILRQAFYDYRKAPHHSYPNLKQVSSVMTHLFELIESDSSAPRIKPREL